RVLLAGCDLLLSGLLGGRLLGGGLLLGGIVGAGGVLRRRIPRGGLVGGGLLLRRRALLSTLVLIVVPTRWPGSFRSAILPGAYGRSGARYRRSRNFSDTAPSAVERLPPLAATLEFSKAEVAALDAPSAPFARPLAPRTAHDSPRPVARRVRALGAGQPG